MKYGKVSFEIEIEYHRLGYKRAYRRRQCKEHEPDAMFFMVKSVAMHADLPADMALWKSWRKIISLDENYINCSIMILLLQRFSF